MKNGFSKEVQLFIGPLIVVACLIAGYGRAEDFLSSVQFRAEADSKAKVSNSALECKVEPGASDKFWCLRIRGDFNIKWPNFDFRSPRPVRISLTPEATFGGAAPILEE